MTVVVPRSTDRYRPTAVVATRPGLTEKLLVVATWFVMLNGTPETWFVESSLAQGNEEGAPLTLAALAGLSTIAGLRVFGQIDMIVSGLRLSLPLLVFFALHPASIFWTVDLALTLRSAIVTACVLVFCVYLLLRYELGNIVVLLAIGSILGWLVNLAFIVGLPQYGLDLGGRWVGVFPQKNATGYTVAMGLPLVLAAAGFDNRRRTLYYAFAGLAIAMLWFSESKTMLVATAIPVLSMLFYHGFRSRKTLRGAVITMMVTSAVIAALFATANLAFVADILEKDVTLTGRTEIWENLIPVFLERPIFGHGADATFGGWFSPIHEVWAYALWEPQHAHNAVFQIALDFGLIGVVAFLAAFFKGVPNAVHYLRQIGGRVGLWPLTFLTTTLMISISESGVTVDPPGFVLFVVALWVPALAIRDGVIDPRKPFAGPVEVGSQSTGELPELSESASILA